MLHTRRLQSNNYSFELIVGITVKFKGESECRWASGVGGNSTTYSGYEKYFEYYQTVFGSTCKLI
jgi:hypothetical protein